MKRIRGFRVDEASGSKMAAWDRMPAALASVTETRTRNDEMVGRDLHQIPTNTQKDQKGHVSESDWI